MVTAMYGQDHRQAPTPPKSNSRVFTDAQLADYWKATANYQLEARKADAAVLEAKKALAEANTKASIYQQAREPLERSCKGQGMVLAMEVDGSGKPVTELVNSAGQPYCVQVSDTKKP
jgi:hypothetical protein